MFDTKTVAGKVRFIDPNNGEQFFILDENDVYLAEFFTRESAEWFVELWNTRIRPPKIGETVYDYQGHQYTIETIVNGVDGAHRFDNFRYRVTFSPENKPGFRDSYEIYLKHDGRWYLW